MYFDQQIKNNNDDFGWGVVLSYKKQEDKKNPTEAPTITVDVILRVSEATAASKVRVIRHHAFSSNIRKRGQKGWEKLLSFSGLVYKG